MPHLSTMEIRHDPSPPQLFRSNPYKAISSQPADHWSVKVATQ